MNTIKQFRGDYYFLSNFFEAPITYNGLTFSNNEAAFQAQKTLDETARKSFCTMNPSEAKRAGRKVSLRKDWEEVKVSIMTDIVRAKFEQNPDLRQKLFNTGNTYLEEGNTWGDRIWGTVNGSGQNLLGNILMNTRMDLQKESAEEIER